MISPGLKDFYKIDVLCSQWLNSSGELYSHDQIHSLLLIGLYEDFTQANVLEILDYCRRKKISVYTLIGRDLSSLTWMIAKQFLLLYDHNLENGVFTHKRINGELSNTPNWKVYDIKSLEKEDIKKILEKKHWDTIVFHGHGKEDHLNLDDFTLNGLNYAIPKKAVYAPSIGHEGQKFFKDIDKAISPNKLMARTIYFLSCNNLPFKDSSLYDSRYNIVLNAIDGITRDLIVSLSVQVADTPELFKILSTSNRTNDIDVKMHESLKDIQPFTSIVHIGMPKKGNVNEEKQDINSEVTSRLTDTSKTIISRISSFNASMMLDQNHPIPKLARKISEDYSQISRRGTVGSNINESKQWEKNLINRVNPFSKKIAEIMFTNQNDSLHDFDTFNILRSTTNEQNSIDSVCTCGGVIRNFTYIPETSQNFPIESSYCYRCGDKVTKMKDAPDIQFTCDEFNADGFTINYKLKIIPKQVGDIYLGIQVPNYLKQSVINIPPLQRIKVRKLKTIEQSGNITFSKDVILQSYYLEVFLVQNAGISISRCFFNLISDEEKQRDF